MQVRRLATLLSRRQANVAIVVRKQMQLKNKSNLNNKHLMLKLKIKLRLEQVLHLRPPLKMLKNKQMLMKKPKSRPRVLKVILLQRRRKGGTRNQIRAKLSN